MSRKLVVAIPPLPEKYRAAIAAAAEQNDFEACFFNSIDEAKEAAKDAEIIFSMSNALTAVAEKLRWVCTPSAGVNQFGVPGAFANPDAMLTNSSGAYGVTIAEHIVMVTLEIMRRQQEYNGIVARHEWVHDLPLRSIRDSRIALLGTGDIGREAAIRLRASGPASMIGVNRSSKDDSGLFAALDVFEKEPLQQNNSIWECPNLLLTPHVAGNMTLPHTVERIVELFLEDFARYCKGEKLKQLVDIKQGY